MKYLFIRGNRRDEAPRNPRRKPATAPPTVSPVQSAVLPTAVCFIALAFFLRLPGAGAQGANFIRAHYSKRDYWVPMRDGVRLFTSVYSPRDTSREYAIMMNRSPYSIAPYGQTNYPGVLGPSDAFARHGFIFVYQDVRGRHKSQGRYIDMPPHKRHFSGPADTDETTDAADGINWLVGHVPNNNRRVGLWGISYNGFYAAQAMINASPFLKADSPQAPMGDEGNGDDIYHNGAFFLAANFGFYSGFWPRNVNPPPFSYGTPDAYRFFLRMGPLPNAETIRFKHLNPYWDDILKHPDYDWFWSSRALGPVMTNLTAPVLVVGGWFDAEDLGGTFKLFQAIREHGRPPAATLVMGPWAHGEWGHPGGESLGNLRFGSRTCDFFETNIQYPFFLDALDPAPTNNARLPLAWMFETGKNEWRRFDSWPPANAVRRSLYLYADGKISFDPPRGRQKFDQYVSDPARPVPVTSEIGGGMPGDYMTRDQRFAARRPDVLVFESAPLTNDIIVAGPITPVLRVSTSGTDSDFIVKLIDVYPDNTPSSGNVPWGGYQQMVRG
ncbi:MAG: CocE/NonD family hydrolase, partial [Limisphaerales bacterium]